MVKRLQCETGDGEQVVIATGGLANFVKGVSKSIDVVDEFLTLYGLTIIYRLNKKEC